MREPNKPHRLLGFVLFPSFDMILLAFPIECVDWLGIYGETVITSNTIDTERKKKHKINSYTTPADLQAVVSAPPPFNNL